MTALWAIRGFIGISKHFNCIFEISTPRRDARKSMVKQSSVHGKKVKMKAAIRAGHKSAISQISSNLLILSPEYMPYIHHYFAR